MMTYGIDFTMNKKGLITKHIEYKEVKKELKGQCHENFVFTETVGV